MADWKCIRIYSSLLLNSKYGRNNVLIVVIKMRTTRICIDLGRYINYTHCGFCIITLVCCSLRFVDFNGSYDPVGLPPDDYMSVQL